MNISLKDYNKKIEQINNAIKEDGIPLCLFCMQKMKRYTPSKGRFKGQVQKHCFYCGCKDYPKKMVISIG